jgi:hypothetical protein
VVHQDNYFLILHIERKARAFALLVRANVLMLECGTVIAPPGAAAA